MMIICSKSKTLLDTAAADPAVFGRVLSTLFGRGTIKDSSHSHLDALNCRTAYKRPRQG